jgi:CheY-like chemotaxis protein
MELEKVVQLDGLIVVADDQHINIEILKQHTLKLRVIDQTIFCVNGQQVIDCVDKLVRKSIDNIDLSQSKSLTPVSILLLDFQMPIKTGI